ncbi:hypothetical protein [Aquimarina sp. 2201CG14-23]|uniref:hypothetical protein n=1 Tax=Aquimarina mycalae TaxID=3040073 RepID=UPI002477FA27|nr:hypothetical protein [Aquimarina sp. 2201CG14-23]MDH7447349.1 hypothetical protein [Aquimarina sp. 2201CG14-23]
MSDKKNIDRLFQEKFKNFEVTPDDAVWEKIKAKKDKDRKRGIIIPFWYRIAGVAALIAVILSVGSVLTNDDSVQDAIVNTEKIENKDVGSEEDQNVDTKTSNDGLVNTAKDQKSNYDDGASEGNNTNNEAITNSSLKNAPKKDLVTNINTNQENTQPRTYKDPSLDKNQLNKESNTTITDTEDKIIKDVSENKKNLFFEQNPDTKNAVTDIKNTDTPKANTQKNSFNNSSQVIKKGIAENSSPTNNTQQGNIPKEEHPIFKEPNTGIKNTESKILAENTKEKTSKDEEKIVSDETEDQTSNDGKKSIFDVIKEKEAKETLVTETTQEKKWNITPNVAPVYYDSFGGSSIDAEFSDNNKQGQINLSYGIQIAYSINKKLSVRSGISKVDVGYNTEDVGFGISSVATGVEGFDNPTNVRNIVVSDYQGGSSDFGSAPDINDEILVKSQNPGLLNHSIGYIEVPLEIKYAITDSKLGVHMIGGVSTLFLEDDDVSIIAGSFKNENVARDETVNDISFSGNIGIGFDYKLSDQFQINMEPIFKYQFNGFKEGAQDFKPYYFGVYTGISFKF